MENKNLKRLNMSVVNIEPSKVISSKKALKDVVPIPWTKLYTSSKAGNSPAFVVSSGALFRNTLDNCPA